MAKCKTKKMAIGGMGSVGNPPAGAVNPLAGKKIPAGLGGAPAGTGGPMPRPQVMPAGGRQLPIQQQPARPLPGGAGRPTVDAIPMPGAGGGRPMPDTRMSKPGPMPMPDTRMSKPGPMPMPDTRMSKPGPMPMPDTGMSKPGPMPMPGGVKPMTAGPQGMAIKKGGAIKAKKMAVGGKVGSASKRADGCAQRGKTKGRMV